MRFFRRKVIKIQLIIMLVIIIGFVIAYFIIKDEKPVYAAYLLGCCGLIVINVLISIYYVYKNFRD